MIGGKRGVALYLIPEGYEVTEDAGGYFIVTRKAEVATPAASETKDAINPEDIPF